jgi:phosphatidylinositol phosphate synthase
MYPPEIPSLATSLLPPLALLAVLLSLLGIFAASQRFGRRSFRSPERGDSLLLSRFLRSYWYWLLHPVEEGLVRTRIEPQTLNYVGVACSLASGVLFAFGHFQAAGGALLLAGCLDMLDGQVARKSGRTSLRGAFLDSALDRYSELVVYLGLMFYYRDDDAVWLCTAFALGGSFMVSYCRARGEALGIAVQDVGTMQRAERLMLLIIASLLTPLSLSLQHLAGLRPATWLLAATLVVLAAGANWTAMTRFRHVLDALGGVDRAAGKPEVRPSTPPSPADVRAARAAASDVSGT